MLPVPEGVLPVTVLQNALDAYLAARPQAGIDFIHGTDTLLHLADAPSRIGFVLPDFPKAQLFPYVMQRLSLIHIFIERRGDPRRRLRHLSDKRKRRRHGRRRTRCRLPAF